MRLFLLPNTARPDMPLLPLWFSKLEKYKIKKKGSVQEKGEEKEPSSPGKGGKHEPKNAR